MCTLRHEYGAARVWRYGSGAGLLELAEAVTMKATRYFEEQVLRKRPYLSLAQCATVLASPSRKAVQSDGRIRWWGHVADARDGTVRILRVVTLDDGETIHNAFFDRGYREDSP